MSISPIAVQQREKEQKALRSFLTFSLIGSAALHIVVLTLGSLWVRKPELSEAPIEVIVVDSPSFQAAKPKQQTKSKGETVAIGSVRKSGTQSVGKIAAGRTKNGSQGGGTPATSSAPSSQSTASQPEMALAPPRFISKKPSKPTETAITQKPLDTKPPKLVETPKPLPTPVTTLPPQPVETPKVAETPPPVPTLPLKMTPTPVATLPPKPVETPKPTPAATLPPKPTQIGTSKRVSTPTPSPTPTSEPTSTSQPSVPIVPSPPQEIAGNGVRQSDNPREVDEHPSVATSSGNRDSGSPGDSSNRDSGQSSGTGSRLGTSPGNGSGNARAVATGPRNGGDFGSTGSGSSGLACRRCPAPEYPPGAENLEGRAVVDIDVDRDGNVNNVQIVESTGHDILDQSALETVKEKWKFTSSENGQRVRAAVNFATPGSDFYRQAREREHQARELAQQRERERQARELVQQKERERQSRELAQRRERERLNSTKPTPQPITPETAPSPLESASPLPKPAESQ